MTDELTFFRLRVCNSDRATLWHPGFPDDDLWSLADWSNAVCGEAGEMANVVKKIRRQETGGRGAKDPDIATLYSMLGDEIADTLIYADLLAAKAGIDLDKAIINKFDQVSRREGFPIFLGDAT